jgi:hypothetical protein
MIGTILLTILSAFFIYIFFEKFINDRKKQLTVHNEKNEKTSHITKSEDNSSVNKTESIKWSDIVQDSSHTTTVSSDDIKPLSTKKSSDTKESPTVKSTNISQVKKDVNVTKNTTNSSIKEEVLVLDEESDKTGVAHDDDEDEDEFNDDEDEFNDDEDEDDNLTNQKSISESYVVCCPISDYDEHKLAGGSYYIVPYSLYKQWSENDMDINECSIGADKNLAIENFKKINDIKDLGIFHNVSSNNKIHWELYV